MKRKTDLSVNTRSARRKRLSRAQETDEERSERQAAARERSRQYQSFKKNMIQEMSIGQVRIENVRTLRPDTDKYRSEKDWLKAVKARMHTEKMWLNSIKDRLNSDKGRLSMRGQIVKNELHCKPENYEKGIVKCEMDQLSLVRDQFKSEKDPSNSEWDPLNLVNNGLNSNPNLRGNTQTGDLDTYEVTVKVEVFDD